MVQTTMTAFINQSDPNILIPYVITSKDFRDNSSLLEEAPTLTTSASVKATVLCVMAVASLIGNLATLISIAVSKKGTSSSLYTLLFQVFTSVSVICYLYRLHCCTLAHIRYYMQILLLTNYMTAVHSWPSRTFW